LSLDDVEPAIRGAWGREDVRRPGRVVGGDRGARSVRSHRVTIDLTREQFRNGEALGEPRVEELVLTDRNQQRFTTLRERVRSQLRLDG
jgi:hypothetical protein